MSEMSANHGTKLEAYQNSFRHRIKDLDVDDYEGEIDR